MKVEPLPPPPIQVAIWGRKGQGKSELAWMLWDSWGSDRLVLDVTKDVEKHHPDKDTITLEPPCPARWPLDLLEPDKRSSLRYVGDPTSADWEPDLDRAVGLAYAHEHCLVWIEEAGLVAPAGRTRPHCRAALHMGRHNDLSSIWTMPRPMDIDPLVLANADVCYMFKTPNPDDRRRAAAAMGIAPKELDDANAALGDHEYLRYVANTAELLLFPKLPRVHEHATRAAEYAATGA